MGKRGPKASGKYGKKGATLGVRITIETRKRLESAAAANQRTLSEEVDKRLASSFKPEERFAGMETYALFRLAAELIKDMEQSTGQSWRRDRFTYEMVMAGIKVLFDLVRPEGDGAPPETFPNISILSAELRAQLRELWTRSPLHNVVYPTVQQLGSRVKSARYDDESVDRVIREIADVIGKKLKDKPLPLDVGFPDPAWTRIKTKNEGDLR